jgi:septal ring factor EnvC (AmiA/AmiB activator)
MRMQTVFRPIVLVVLGILALPAEAQTQRAPPPGGGGNPQAALQLQQATAENTRLKKELEDAKAKLATVTKEASGSKEGTAALRSALAAAQAATKASDQAHDQTRARLQELLDRFRQTTGNLAGVETERGQLRQDLGAMTARFDTCAQRNVDLYDAFNEALAKAEGRGFFSALGRSEPFTKIERVRLENAIDEYRVRAQELRVSREPPKSTAKP